MYYIKELSDGKKLWNYTENYGKLLLTMEKMLVLK